MKNKDNNDPSRSHKNVINSDKKSRDSTAINNLRDQINTLNYEESLAKLDSFLEKLQSETVAVQELQDSYMKASLYLEHCRKLLENIEHDIVELDLDDFN